MTDYSNELITPKARVREDIVLAPEIHVFLNADRDVIKIQKLTVNGEIFERQITDPEIIDYVVDDVIIVSAWGKVRGG